MLFRSHAPSPISHPNFTSRSSSSSNRSFISSWRDHHHHHHDYNPFRFTDAHHHYDPTSSYYPDPATVAATMDSYASTANNYSPYMAHQHSSPPLPLPPPSSSNNSASIKPETAAAAALQSALSLSTPMNVNVSMNFNSHSVQYTAGYGAGSGSANFSNSPYDSFYNSASSAHYPFGTHSPEMKGNRSSSSSASYLPTDPVTQKQAMILSAAAANYDYKDLSKLCDFFPTPSSSSATSMSMNDKRR